MTYQELCYTILTLLATLGLYFYWKFINLKVENTDRTGGHIIAEALKSLGVKQAFTLVGGHISSILVECDKLGIKIIDVRDEASTVFAADIIGRLTNIPGVAMVTAGPGVTNTTTALQNAKMAQSPLLLIGGAAPTLLKGRGALQDIDQVSAIAPYVKKVFSCTTVRSILPNLQKAMQLAIEHPRGPVFLEAPIDLLYSNYEVQANMGLLKRKLSKYLKKSEYAQVCIPTNKNSSNFISNLRDNQPVFLKIKPKMPWWLTFYMQMQLRWLFGNAFKENPLIRLKQPKQYLNQNYIQKVSTLLKNSKKPIIVLGSQSVQSIFQANSLITSIEKLNIPVFLSGMARGLLGKNHPLHISQGKTDALKTADLIFLCGVEIDFRMNYGKKLSKRAKIVVVHPVVKLTKQNSDIFWKPTLRIHCHPNQLLESLQPNNYQMWINELQKKSLDKINTILNTPINATSRKNQNEKAIHPLQLSLALEKVIPENAIVIGDGGDFIGTVANVLTGRGVFSWLDPGSFGTLGVGGGFAMAAKQVYPEKPIWLLWGDGSCGFSIAEIDTLCRHNLPIIAVIGNDAGWTQIERDQKPIFDSDIACPLEYTHYEQVGQGYGATGILIKYGDSIEDKLHLAEKICLETQKPVVVNVLMGSSNFREGSISV